MSNCKWFIACDQKLVTNFANRLATYEIITAFSNRNILFARKRTNITWDVQYVVGNVFFRTITECS